MSELPTGQDILDKYQSINSLDEKGLIETKNYLFKSFRAIKQIISEEIDNNDYVVQPEKRHAEYLKYHNLVGGLFGLANSLNERISFIEYKKLTEEGRDSTAKKDKLVQGDRKIYAEGAVSDLKGLLTDIESTHKNIYQRIQDLAGKIRRYH